MSGSCSVGTTNVCFISSNETFASIHTCTNEGEPKGRCIATQSYSDIYLVELLSHSLTLSVMVASPRSWQSIRSAIVLKLRPCNRVSFMASSKMKIVLIFISYRYVCARSFPFDFVVVVVFIFRLFLLPSFRCFSIKFISRQSFGYTIFFFSLSLASLTGSVCVCALMWICVLRQI